MYQEYKDKTPNRCSSSLQICLSLSYVLYTSECVCQMRNTPLFILFLSLEFVPNQVGPNKLTGLTSPRKTQNNIILYSGGFYWPKLQCRFYLITLWWPNTIVTSRRRNKTSPIDYISKIHLEYSLKLQYFNILQAMDDKFFF